MEEIVYRRSLVGPLVLIGLGVIFLLNNLGILSWGVWETILRLWPLLLIALGVEILLGQRFAWGSAVAVLIVLGVAGLTVLLSGVSHFAAGRLAEGRPVTTQTIGEMLDGAKSAEIEIEAGVGELALGALEDERKLIEGTIPRVDGLDVYRDFRRQGDKVFFALRSRHPHFFWDRRRHRADWTWILNLNRRIPLQVRINTGVGLSELDLSQIRATEVEVKTGIGKTVLTLPSTGVVRARCEGGIGEIEIRIPHGTAARIRAHGGIGVVEVNGRRLDGLYESPAYAQAKARVDLEVKGGIGKIAIMAENEW